MGWYVDEEGRMVETPDMPPQGMSQGGTSGGAFGHPSLDKGDFLPITHINPADQHHGMVKTWRAKTANPDIQHDVDRQGAAGLDPNGPGMGGPSKAGRMGLGGPDPQAGAAKDTDLFAFLAAQQAENQKARQKLFDDYSKRVMSMYGPEGRQKPSIGDIIGGLAITVASGMHKGVLNPPNYAPGYVNAVKSARGLGNSKERRAALLGLEKMRMEHALQAQSAAMSLARSRASEKMMQKWMRGDPETQRRQALEQPKIIIPDGAEINPTTDDPRGITKGIEGIGISQESGVTQQDADAANAIIAQSRQARAAGQRPQLPRVMPAGVRRMLNLLGPEGKAVVDTYDDAVKQGVKVGEYGVKRRAQDINERKFAQESDLDFLARKKRAETLAAEQAKMGPGTKGGFERDEKRSEAIKAYEDARIKVLDFTRIIDQLTGGEENDRKAQEEYKKKFGQPDFWKSWLGEDAAQRNFGWSKYVYNEPGGAAQDWWKLYEGIDGRALVRGIEQMRSAITGATGMGALNEKEADAIKQSMLAVGNAQSHKQAVAELKRLRGVIMEQLDRARDQVVGLYGDGSGYKIRKID